MTDRKSANQIVLRSGQTLLEAADSHASRSLIRKLARIKPPEDPYLYPGIEMMVDAPQRPEFIKGAKQIAGSWSAFKERNEIIWKIRGHLLKKLVSGELIAIGYEATAPKMGSRLPSYLFEHEDFINWQKSSVKGHGLHYLSVKVLFPDQIAAIDHGVIESLDNKNDGKGGRPTSRIRVSEAIWAQMKNNKNFAGLPIKTQIFEVKKYILDNHADEFPGNKGLSDKTIGTHIRILTGRKLPPKI